ncbi:hypothetical protein SERLADRAFT_359735 [Serpula lacrymans var. lacrymans S7.9]|uniref:Methyltransferase domain-containing protein n=1 Tax=Serpula lacrymans var. lacrymans (strain S7.9) TaxID=578457 RepID=F8NJH4_SERL9|nr:uncharacterized protein SERLADRAFT_359735 [Serpula lacrymans var. lacrymans S7.9]EGO30024.1 hypothetical protein SERLADRAFT_359735 [Serpula lacrymans var. lacrymans S7.9]
MSELDTQPAKNPPTPLPLDERLYVLKPEASAFFKSHTGIHDDDALKSHILDVQAKAYKIFPYPCIRFLGFTETTIYNLPAYQHVLKLGQERKGAILLDIGCCFGGDVRKAVADGFPVQNVIASDLHAEFWDLGHELFKSTPETFPASFISGDAFDVSYLEAVPPIYDAVETTVPKLNTVTTLNALRGHISALHAAAFFHLFSEEQQLAVGRSLAPLLSPLPGSVIFGYHIGKKEKGLIEMFGHTLFCHCPETWAAMWDGVVFAKGTVRVDVKLQEKRPSMELSPKVTGNIPAEEAKAMMWLVWSVTRL